MTTKRLRRMFAMILITCAGLAACLGAALYLLTPVITTPSFTIHNNTPHPAAVTATWRDRQKSLGTLPPSASVTFTVNDEAAMQFEATLADGTRIDSETPVYFTAGTRVEARITPERIELTAELIGY